MKKKIKYFLIIFVLILFFIWYKQSRKLPIKFKFEKIENDSIVISSIEDLAEFGNKTKILRYDLICPITNDDMTFSNNDGSDNNVTLESDLNYDFSNESNWGKTLIVKKIKNRYYYKTQISIYRKNIRYKKNTLTNKEIVNFIKKKGDSLECNIGVMYYFFPLPKYSESFCIPSDSLLNYLENKK